LGYEGARSSKTVSKLYQKIKHLNCTFYTDNWEAFAKILPKKRHPVGQALASKAITSFTRFLAEIDIL